MNYDEWKAALLEKLNLDPNKREHQSVAEACLVYCDACDDAHSTAIERIVDPEFGDGEVEEYGEPTDHTD